MDGIYFNSSLGPLHLVGQIYADPARPALLVVGGAFPPRDFKHELAERFPGASVAVIRYPGMHAAAWTDPRPERVALGVDELIRRWLPERRIVAFGLSTGCLVTLNLQQPEVRHHVVLEPFLQTSHMAPFIQYLRDVLAATPDSQALRDFAWKLFGVSATEALERDYRSLASDPALPLDLIVGGPAAAARGWPSFTRDEDREILMNRPEARLHVGPDGSGHFVETTPATTAMIEDVLRRALKSLTAGPAPSSAGAA